MLNDNDYRSMSVGQAAATALDLMEEELKEAQRAEDMKIFGLMAQSKLSETEAMLSWARKQTLYLIHARLLAKVHQGHNAAKRIAGKADNG